MKSKGVVTQACITHFGGVGAYSHAQTFTLIEDVCLNIEENEYINDNDRHTTPRPAVYGYSMISVTAVRSRESVAPMLVMFRNTSM